jgi:hypothetical protein
MVLKMERKPLIIAALLTLVLVALAQTQPRPEGLSIRDDASCH